MRGGLLCQAGRSNNLHKASGLVQASWPTKLSPDNNNKE